MDEQRTETAAASSSESLRETLGSASGADSGKQPADVVPPAPEDGAASLDVKPQSASRPGGREALREALLLWAAAFAVIILVRAAGPLAGYAKIAAALAFLYLPGAVVWRRGEDYRDYGADFSRWPRDLGLGLAVSLAVLPVFALGFWLVFQAMQTLDWPLLDWLVPYRKGLSPAPELRFPPRFWEHILDQFLMVALPEEFFYRGYLQRRLRDVWPGGRRIGGSVLGPAFWLTALLFALGHLAVFQVWRLAVFFPALIFGWLRERSGSILPGIVFHALSNLTLFVLEASFLGVRAAA